MDGSDGNAKARILAVTLRMIEISGVASVSVRRVAAEAKVNVASINYYFGNKDGLIHQALKGLMGDFFAAFDLLERQDDPRIKLKEFLRAYIDAALRYPDIVRGMVELSMTGQSQTDFGFEEQAAGEYERYVQSKGIERIMAVIEQITGVVDKQDLIIMAVQTMSSLTVPLLTGPAARRVTGIDLNVPHIRDRYIDMLIDRL